MVKDLDREIRFGFLVHDVSRLRRIVVDRALKPLGITRSQWWVLSFLSRRDGMTQTALASDLDLTKVAIGGLIDRMETAGLVQRRLDAEDARARRVYLTKSGQKMVNTIRMNVDQVEGDIRAKVSDADLDHASKTLLTFKQTLLDLIGSESGEASDDFSLKIIEGE
jgi:DNA-binding MarR family transcriptional regulator